MARSPYNNAASPLHASHMGIHVTCSDARPVASCWQAAYIHTRAHTHAHVHNCVLRSVYGCERSYDRMQCNTYHVFK